MNPLLDSPTLFVDTQALIYAFEKEEPAWVELIESRLSSGYRLVLSEELLYEFAQSGTLKAALELTRRVVQRTPLWIRSFADLEADEVCRFARKVATGGPVRPVSVFVESFPEVSQLGEKHKFNPEEFVQFAFDPRARDVLSALAKRHAQVLNELSRAVDSGQFTKEVNDKAIHTGLQAWLSRGSYLTAPLVGGELEAAVKLCFKHHKWLMRECPAYATEYHLVDYRTASPKRLARPSDSKDLMLATAAFPYVSTFITNDGYLHGALCYVKKRRPDNRTVLVRGPIHNAV